MAERKKNTHPESHFAPASRLSPETLKKNTRSLIADPIIDIVLKSVGGFVLILDTHRQIITANQAVLDALQLKENDPLIGLRPGEAFKCEHATEMPYGCGTSLSCQDCGAVLAILAAQKELKPSKNQCSLAMVRNEKLECREFKVHVNPLELHGNTVYVFVLEDISSEFRKAVLERSFLHDMRNTIAGLAGWGDMLPMEDNPRFAAKKIVRLSEILSKEIEDHYTLLLAENGDLGIKTRVAKAGNILDSAESIFSRHKLAKNKNIVYKRNDREKEFTTDQDLLVRIVTNMIKNALEATPSGGTVTVWYEEQDERPGFKVHNEGEIPEHVARRIFQRSFSTKTRKGRGIGTYSMKLFGEYYLKGSVAFTTSASTGTIFSFHFPWYIEPT
ncbi:MAG: hypothetical protein GF350_06045 [Chitinivibrionales bacterium]|nr:hypothetical protein [Chitinivibrionales bacterium]